MYYSFYSTRRAAWESGKGLIELSRILGVHGYEQATQRESLETGWMLKAWAITVRNCFPPQRGGSDQITSKELLGGKKAALVHQLFEELLWEAARTCLDLAAAIEFIRFPNPAAERIVQEHAPDFVPMPIEQARNRISYLSWIFHDVSNVSGSKRGRGKKSDDVALRSLLLQEPLLDSYELKEISGLPASEIRKQKGRIGKRFSREAKRIEKALRGQNQYPLFPIYANPAHRRWLCGQTHPFDKVNLSEIESLYPNI